MYFHLIHDALNEQLISTAQQSSSGKHLNKPHYINYPKFDYARTSSTSILLLFPPALTSHRVFRMFF